MFSKMNYKLSALAVATMLAACGGGDGGGEGAAGGSGPQGSVKLSGQVIDGPIEGAKVCLFVDGAAASDAAKAAICSNNTDAEGNYSLMVPRSLDAGLLTLIASKGSNIQLVSALGTLEEVLAAAGSSDEVTAANLPAARVTHFTTADFVLSDTNNDGILSTAERDAYVPDINVSQDVAAIIKAVIDFPDQAAGLLGGETTDTLALALAAARNQPLGTTGKTADEWLAEPANANIREAVQKDLADSVTSDFVRYEFTGTVTAANGPASDIDGPLACAVASVGEDEVEVVEIALDGPRGIVVVKNIAESGEASQVVGAFNAKTGEFKLNEVEPRYVTLSSGGTTFYTESISITLGKIDAQSGTITGTISDSETNSWSGDAATKTCTSEGTFKAVKI